MRARWGLVMVAGWGMIGCGPPDIVPMTPPGVAVPRISTDTSEAMGEQVARPGIQQPPSGGETPKPVPATNNLPGRTDIGGRPPSP